MVSFDVTHYALSLGAQDTVTGWYAKTFAVGATISMNIEPKGSSVKGLPVGNYAKYDLTGFTETSIDEGDEVKRSDNKYLTILNVEDFWWGDSFSHYRCSLNKPPWHIQRPATSGTPPTVQDPRQRTRTFLSTYLVAANITEDDGVTLASFITHFAYPDYPLKKVFDPAGKNVDVVYAVDVPKTSANYDYAGSIYSYNEAVPVTISTVDKTGITGHTLLWKAFLELRTAVQDHAPPRTDTWVGSFRSIDSVVESRQDMGGWTLYGLTCNLNYMRDLTG